jgi:hypothetical protein
MKMWPTYFYSDKKKKKKKKKKKEMPFPGEAAVGVHQIKEKSQTLTDKCGMFSLICGF